MASQIPDSTRDLFERPIVCALSTVNPDGQPHTVPVWVDFDGTYVRVNSPDTTKKSRNMSVGTKVTVLLVDPQNPFHWIEVMGHVAEIRDETHGAREHINSLAKKYTGNDLYQEWGGQKQNRSMFLIAPDKIHGF